MHRARGRRMQAGVACDGADSGQPPHSGPHAHASDTASDAGSVSDEAEQYHARVDSMLTEAHGRYQHLAMASLGLANAADSAELMFISFVMPELPFTDATLGVLSGCMFAGMIVGGLGSGVLADGYGRKHVLTGSMLINLVFGILIVLFPTSWVWLFLCRVVSGVGVGGTVPVMFTMSAESVGSAHRGRFISVVCSYWLIGGLYVAGLCWVVLGHLKAHWTWAAVFAQAPNLIALGLIQALLYETPRYYIARGRYDEGLKIAERIVLANTKARGGAERVPRGECDVEAQAPGHAHAGGEMIDLGGTGDDVDNNDADDAATVHTTASPHPGEPMVGGTRGDSSQAASPPAPQATGRTCSAALRELSSKPYRRMTILLFVQWATLSFGWYGIVMWIPKLFVAYGATFDVYQQAFMVQVANIPGTALCTFLIGRMPSLKLLCGSMLASSVVCVVMGMQRDLHAIVALACVYNGVSIMGWNALSDASAAAFPTHVRSTAVGLLSAVGKAASGASQVVFGLMFDQHLDTSYILFTGAGMMVCGAVAAALLLSHLRTSPWVPSAAMML